jgi:hypothetical protein
VGDRNQQSPGYRFDRELSGLRGGIMIRRPGFRVLLHPKSLRFRGAAIRASLC